VRFDDMLATILAQDDAGPATRAAKWRQIVDLLAQGREDPDPEQLTQALLYLREHRDQIDRATRREIALTLAGRRVSPLLVRFFGEDDPAIAAALVATVRLSADQWVQLLPRLTVTARALLRHRRDLETEVVQALAAFGASDFVLSGTVASMPAEANSTVDPAAEKADEAMDAGDPQIRELVARIEEFRKSRPRPGQELRPAQPPLDAPLEDFRWETGADGVILWVDEAPRGPLIGSTIAYAAARSQSGVDGQAAGAFEKRAPFRDARFTVAGAGPAAGDWRISGVPFFHPTSGAFLGYRGTARRPRLDEVARSEASGAGGLFGTSLPAESLRQLIHELRTPLNAITGFAEMIEGQYLGPAGSDYRLRAREIIDQSSRLLSAVDDLDTAARIETHRLELAENAADTVGLLWRLHDAYEQIALQRQAHVAIEVAPELPLAQVDPAAAERMFARLLAATIGLARAGEAIGANLSLASVGGKQMLCLAIDRPAAIHGLDESALLDPGYSPDGDWPGAPILGLGFALRLVRNLAEAASGALTIGDRRFFLYLPVEHAEQSSKQGV
jgi:signal transduction histidine kinase